MTTFILSGLAVFAVRILQDLLFNMKIELFNRGKTVGVFFINFAESIIGLTVIAVVVNVIDSNPYLLIFLGLGSSTGGLIVLKIRDMLNVKLIGQRQYFARIAFTGNEDLVDILRTRGFIFTVEEREFLDGIKRTVVQGSLENRDRKEELKSLLRGREDKLVTIIPAREVYSM